MNFRVEERKSRFIYVEEIIEKRRVINYAA